MEMEGLLSAALALQSDVGLFDCMSANLKGVKGTRMTPFTCAAAANLLPMLLLYLCCCSVLCS
jgi:hypothetical protein